VGESVTAHGVATSKGTILKSLVKFLEQDLTKEQFQQAVAMLPPDDAALVRGKILASLAVPEAMLNRLTEAAAKAKGEDLEKFGIRAGLAELADSVGMYRVFLMALTPPSLLSKVSTFWSSIHNTGKLVILDQSKTHVRFQLKDFPSERAHCVRLTGWCKGLAEMTKVKNVRIEHDTCMTRGAAHCEWDLRWDE
jgi:hypothetical protein